MKRTVNGFNWLIVTNFAKLIYKYNVSELYVLHQDESESLVTNPKEISLAISNGLDIGIEW